MNLERSLQNEVSSTTVDVKYIIVSKLFDMPEGQKKQSLQYLHHVLGCENAKELGSGAFATAYAGKIQKGYIFNVDPEKEFAIKFYNTVERDFKYELSIIMGGKFIRII